MVVGATRATSGAAPRPENAQNAASNSIRVRSSSPRARREPDEQPRPSRRRQRSPAELAPHSPVDCLQSTWQQQEAVLHAVILAALGQAMGPRQPAARVGHLSCVHQRERQPERATRCPLRLAAALQQAERPGPRGRIVGIPSEQVNRHPRAARDHRVQAPTRDRPRTGARTRQPTPAGGTTRVPAPAHRPRPLPDRGRLAIFAPKRCNHSRPRPADISGSQAPRRPSRRSRSARRILDRYILLRCPPLVARRVPS